MPLSAEIPAPVTTRTRTIGDPERVALRTSFAWKRERDVLRGRGIGRDADAAAGEQAAAAADAEDDVFASAGFVHGRHAFDGCADIHRPQHLAGVLVVRA